MPFGPGKYGARAEALLREVDAELVIVITVAGREGAAFDVAVVRPELIKAIPALLRRTARGIKRDVRRAEGARA